MIFSKKQIITLSITLFILIILPIFIKPVFASSNIALGKATNASGNYFPSSNAVDGNLGNMWNSGGYPPQWIEIDLGSEQQVNEIKLYVQQSPGGNSTHEIWTADSSHNFNTKIDTVSENTSSGQVLDRQYNPALGQVRYVKVLTTVEPNSWVAWGEVEVYGPDQISATPTFIPSPTSTPQPTVTPTSIPPSPTITLTSPTFTPVPTVTPTPGGPTSTPTPTVTPGGPSLTPTPTDIPGPCPAKRRGDANCDGKVDSTDFNIWLQEYDTMVPASPISQNANYACVEGNSQTYFVDLVDFEVWRRNAAPASLFLPVNPTIPVPGQPNAPCLDSTNCNAGFCCTVEHGICEPQNTPGITCKAGTPGTHNPAPTATAQRCNSDTECRSDQPDPQNWYCNISYTHTCYHEKGNTGGGDDVSFVD